MTRKPIVALLIGVAVFAAAVVVTDLTAGKAFGENAVILQVLMKLVFAVLSVLTALLLKLPLSVFNFFKGYKIRVTWKYALFAALLGAIASVLMLVLNVPPVPLVKGMPLVLMILVIWFWSSLCEEIFARGLVQGLLKDDPRSFAFPWLGSVSVGSLVSAGAFSLVHFSIFVKGGSIYTALFIMFFTFLLGLMCGQARDRSCLGSAVIVHAAFNVGGFIGAVISNILLIIITGKLPVAG